MIDATHNSICYNELNNKIIAEGEYIIGLYIVNTFEIYGVILTNKNNKYIGYRSGVKKLGSEWVWKINWQPYYGLNNGTYSLQN